MEGSFHGFKGASCEGWPLLPIYLGLCAAGIETMKPLRMFTLHLVCLTVSLTFLSTVTQAENKLKTTDAETQPSQSARVIHFANDLLTVKVQDVSLQELLQEIARQSGLAIVLSGSLEDPITIQFHELPFDSGLRRILRHQSFALEYSQQTREERQSIVPRPKKLWVFSKGDADYPVQTTRVDGSSEQETTLDSPRLPAIPTSEDSGERQEAVEAPADPLTTIWGEEPARALANALEDDNFWVRDAAVEALGELSGDEAARALAMAVQNEETWIREAAVKALGKLGGDEAAYALAPALKDEHSWIRWEAVKALGEVGGESTVRLLEQALADEDKSIQEAAADMLARLGDQIR